MNEQVYAFELLKAYTEMVFATMGCNEADAQTAAKVLLSADLRGIDSHGIARLVGYVRLHESGRVNAHPEMKIIHESPSTAVVDGDAGLGLVVAPYAMQLAIAKAKIAGTGWVSVCNSNHFGIAGAHAMMALPHDMIGIAMTNASALVAPTFATERMLGTNPIAVAIPAGSQPPFVADMATTTAANGKLEILQRQQRPMPEGWAQQADGGSSTDPNELKKGGALLPLGSKRSHGSHKGYALGSIVDIFSAVLSGASFGPWAPPFPAYVPMPENMPGKGLGHFFGAMRIDAFQTAASFKEKMDLWISRFRAAKPVSGQQQVLIPGDPEREMEAIRMREGIPLHPTVVEDLNNLSQQLGIATLAELKDGTDKRTTEH
jgi:L-2-hydroxycarboxylate dehydrogenase (NAD+)